MAKPEAWRLETGNYPVYIVIPPRYADLDTLGHINNVAMAAMFETARVHFHHLLGHHPADAGVRWLVAAVDLSYVAEAHFPYDVAIYSGIGRIGNSSWTLYSAAFQQGECVATCNTVMALQGPKGSKVIDAHVRSVMEGNMASPGLITA